MTLKLANLLEVHGPFVSNGTSRLKSKSVSLLGGSGGDGGREEGRAAESWCLK